MDRRHHLAGTLTYRPIGCEPGIAGLQPGMAIGSASLAGTLTYRPIGCEPGIAGLQPGMTEDPAGGDYWLAGIERARSEDDTLHTRSPIQMKIRPMNSST